MRALGAAGCRFEVVAWAYAGIVGVVEYEGYSTSTGSVPANHSSCATYTPSRFEERQCFKTSMRSRPYGSMP